MIRPRREAAADREEAAQARQKASEEFHSYVDVRLHEHGARLTIARKEMGESVAACFEDRNEGIPADADEARTWKNRWQAFWDSEKFRKKLDELFAEHVLTSSGMAESIGTAVEDYLTQVDAEERALVADLRIKAGTNPALGLEASLDEESFRTLIEERIREQAGMITASSHEMAIGASGVALASPIGLAPTEAATAATSQLVMEKNLGAQHL